MSSFNWTEEAENRISSIPAGFMHSMTKKRIEEHAAKHNISEITLAVTEEVIETSRAGMGSMMGGDMSGMPAGMMGGGMGSGMPAGMDSMMTGMMSGKKNNSEDVSKKEEEPKGRYHFCFVCGYALLEIPDSCPRCKAPKEKFSLLQDRYLTKAHTILNLYWSDNAKKILSDIPEGYQQNMTMWEVENYCRKHGYTAASADIVEERIAVWKEISNRFKPAMQWDDDILKRVEKIPESIRGMVMREMEKMSEGKNTVTQDVFDKIKGQWENSREFHIKWM